MNLKNLITQFLLLFLVILIFYFFHDDGLYALYAALYGALVSFVNTWVFNYFIYKQAIKDDKAVKESFNSAVKNSFLRMAIVAIMIILGVSVLKLLPIPLISAFVVGQIGFIIDKVIQKNGTR